MTPVCIAFLKGHFGLVDLLLNQPGVDINFRDDKGTRQLSLSFFPYFSDHNLRDKYLITRRFIMIYKL